jgi:peptidoglycan/LPS O-acetylase OafA/YrhL
MFFYAAFVAAVFAILTISTREQSIAVTVSYALIVLAAMLIVWLFLPVILVYAQNTVTDYIHADDNFDDSFYRWLFYYSPYVRVLEFFMGCLAAHTFILHIERPIRPRERLIADIALAVTLGLLGLMGAAYLGGFGHVRLTAFIQFLGLNFLCAPAIAFILLYVARYDSAFTRFMSLPTLVLLGDTSYSIYLVHTWTLRLFERQSAPPLNWLWGGDTALRMLCGIVLTFVVSYATYRLIEVPSRTWLRRKFGATITAVFDGDSAKPSHRTGSSSEKVIQPERVTPSGKQIVFSVSWAALLAAIVVIGQSARTYYVNDKLHRFWFGDRPEIAVATASLGLNCRRDASSKYPENPTPGNVTVAVKQFCDGRQQCDFTVNLDAIGDPASGCGKEFSVDYQCITSAHPNAEANLRSVFVPAPADGKTTRLDCKAGD